MKKKKKNKEQKMVKKGSLSKNRLEKYEKKMNINPHDWFTLITFLLIMLKLNVNIDKSKRKFERKGRQKRLVA